MAIRRIEIARAAWGVSLLVAPRLMLERVNRTRADHNAVRVARVLGARQLTQGVLSGVHPSPEVLAMGVWVDLAHAASAAGLIVADRDRATAGLVNGVTALGWAASGWHDLGTGAVTDPRHDRLRDAMARWVLARVPGGHPIAAKARSRRLAAKGA